jgi:hypothetical protein
LIAAIIAVRLFRSETTLRRSHKLYFSIMTFQTKLTTRQELRIGRIGEIGGRQRSAFTSTRVCFLGLNAHPLVTASTTRQGDLRCSAPTPNAERFIRPVRRIENDEDSGGEASRKRRELTNCCTNSSDHALYGALACFHRWRYHPVVRALGREICRGKTSVCFASQLIFVSSDG